MTVRNGRLGRSSHHGIHGHGPVNVLLEDLTIVNYEVAGIHLAAGRNVMIRNVKVDHTLARTPVLGMFSAARFIQPFVNNIADNCPAAGLTVAGAATDAAAVAAALDALIQDTLAKVEADDLDNIDPLVRNTLTGDEYLPDGGTVYGIVLHSRGVAVNAFKTGRDTPANNNNIKLQNVEITGVRSRNNEIVAISLPTGARKARRSVWPERRDAAGGAPINDPVGAVFQWFKAVDAGGNPVGNPVANAQLLVAKHAGACLDPSFDMSRNSVQASLVGWMENAAATAPLPYGDLICNGDTMFHVGKGVVGLRVDAASDLHLNGVRISNIANYGQPGAEHAQCARNHPAGNVAGDTIFDAVGINVAASVNVHANDVTVCGVESAAGWAMGARFHFDSSSLHGTVAVSGLDGQEGHADVVFDDVHANKLAAESADTCQAAQLQASTAVQAATTGTSASSSAALVGSLVGIAALLVGAALGGALASRRRRSPQVAAEPVNVDYPSVVKHNPVFEYDSD